MKICLLCYRGEPYCGGQGVYIHYLSKELCNLGHEVQLLSGPPYPNVVDAVKVEKLESLDLYGANSGRFPPKLLRILTPLNFYEFMAVLLGAFPEPFTFSMRAYGKLRELFSRQKFDVIHDNQCLGYGLLFMKRFGVPVVATIHHPPCIDRDIDVAQAKGWWKKFRMMRWYSFLTMQRLVSRRIDRIIAVSNSSAGETKRSFKVPEDKLRVVYNGIDSELFKRDESVPKEPNSLIVVRAAGQIKGLLYLLKALQLLKNEIEVKLTIVGNASPDDQYPSRLVREYGLADRVDFTGRISQEELVKRYSAAEIAVVPSLYEGFGFPAAEAMSCQVPVIASRAGALPEVTGEDGEVGMLVPPADAGALAAAIECLLGDGLLRRRMGETGRKRVERNFTWRQAAKKTVEVYQELL